MVQAPIVLSVVLCVCRHVGGIVALGTAGESNVVKLVGEGRIRRRVFGHLLFASFCTLQLRSNSSLRSLLKVDT